MARVKRSTIKRVARNEGVDPNLFLALVNQESGRRKHVVSPAGAIGPTQLMPGTAQSLGVNPNNPIQNLRGGAEYLHEQLQRFHGNRKDALAAYNAGPNAVTQYGGVPPFAETQAYVHNILAAAGNPTVGTAKAGKGGLGPGTVRGPSTAKTIPGVDNSRARQLALLDYFMNERGQPGALIQIAQTLQGLQDTPAKTKTIPGKLVKTNTNAQPQGQGGNGPELQLPRNFTPTHQTAGLPGYPARDIFGKPGEAVRAPVSGRIVKLSGEPPSKGAYEGQGGPFGWSVYIQANNGSTYYLTHFGSRNVKVGQRVKRGQVIGTVGDYPGATPDHIHEGRQR